jgi:hypothetical protein
MKRRHLISCLQVKSFKNYSTYGPGLEDGLVDGGLTVYQEPGLWQPLLAAGLAVSGLSRKLRARIFKRLWSPGIDSKE